MASAHRAIACTDDRCDVVSLRVVANDDLGCDRGCPRPRDRPWTGTPRRASARVRRRREGPAWPSARPVHCRQRGLRRRRGREALAVPRAAVRHRASVRTTRSMSSSARCVWKGRPIACVATWSVLARPAAGCARGAFTYARCSWSGGAYQRRLSIDSAASALATTVAATPVVTVSTAAGDGRRLPAATPRPRRRGVRDNDSRSRGAEPGCEAIARAAPGRSPTRIRTGAHSCPRW